LTSSYGASFARRSPLRLDVEDELIRSLKEQISLERELESAKIAVVQKPDFNLYDCFRLFDLDSNGYISFSELRRGLADLGVYAAYEEMELFFNRYDKNEDGRLRFHEFS
jgi:Ca2+-binding EF-hand superfamily protein